jgi:hypothetical protein
MSQPQTRRPPSPEIDFGQIGDNNPIVVEIRRDQQSGEPRQPTHNKNDSGGNLYVRYLVGYAGKTHSLVCGEGHFYRPDNEAFSRVVYQERAKYVSIERVNEPDPDLDFYWAVEAAEDGALTGAGGSASTSPDSTLASPNSPSAAPSSPGLPQVGDMPYRLADQIFLKCWELGGSYEIDGDSVSEETQYKIAYTLFSAATKQGYENRLPPDWEVTETQEEAPEDVREPSGDEPPLPEERGEADDDLPF